MPRFSKKEFIEIAFITHQVLSTYISRKKVILNTNNEIDTSLSINQDYLDKCIAKHNKKLLKEVLVVEEDEVEFKHTPPAPDPPKKKNKTIKTPTAPLPKASVVKKVVISAKDEAINENAIATHNLERKKKLLEIESLENSNKISLIKLNKLNGVLIPTELVMILFGQHSKSLTTAFHQAAENFVVEMAQSYGVDKPAQAKMRGDLIAVVNKAIEDSLEISRSGIDHVVDEYAINGK